MKSRSIEHQFEFWTHIGQVGGYMYQFDEYTATRPYKETWPSKVFTFKNTNIANLKHAILKSYVPNAIAIDSIDPLNQILIENGFKKTSVVEGMSLKVTSNMVFKKSVNISEVVDEKGINMFTNIASEAFGYSIHTTAIMGLLKDDYTQLFIGKHMNECVSCGILFLDKKGDSGLHMIGTKKQFRGLGIGKEMTQHLLYNALKNKSKNVHLVASKFGAPIYRKYGFVNKGYLNSYIL
ncbi:MAG: GNAT family N-acetyltransferase [Bacteroidota bacterium]